MRIRTTITFTVKDGAKPQEIKDFIKETFDLRTLVLQDAAGDWTAIDEQGMPIKPDWRDAVGGGLT